MSAAAMANWAAGSKGVGPGVKRRVLRIIVSESSYSLYREATERVSFYNEKFGHSISNFLQSRRHVSQASVVQQVEKDIVSAMKAREAERLSTLRMVKAAFKNKEIEKREPLTEAEAQQILTTLIKQRRESVEQFTKGNRPELVEKEQAEIVLIEGYMPKAAGEEEIRKLVEEALAGQTFGPKDMGVAMKAVQAKIQASGLRADGRQVSEIVKAHLAK